MKETGGLILKTAVCSCWHTWFRDVIPERRVKGVLSSHDLWKQTRLIFFKEWRVATEPAAHTQPVRYRRFGSTLDYFSSHHHAYMIFIQYALMLVSSICWVSSATVVNGQSGQTFTHHKHIHRNVGKKQTHCTDLWIHTLHSRTEKMFKLTHCTVGSHINLLLNHLWFVKKNVTIENMNIYSEDCEISALHIKHFSSFFRPTFLNTELWSSVWT